MCVIGDSIIEVRIGRHDAKAHYVINTMQAQDGIVPHQKCPSATGSRLVLLHTGHYAAAPKTLHSGRKKSTFLCSSLVFSLEARVRTHVAEYEWRWRK